MDDKEIQEFIRLCAQARLANRAGAITLYINAIDGFSGFALHTKLKAIAGMQAATDEKRQDMMRRTVLADVDKWIEKQYQEIAQAALRVALDNLTEQQTPSVKPVQRSQAQDFAILNALIEAGYDPKAVPVNQSGKAGIKAQISAQLKDTPLFIGATVFTKAWQRLREQGDIKDAI